MGVESSKNQKKKKKKKLRLVPTQLPTFRNRTETCLFTGFLWPYSTMLPLPVFRVVPSVEVVANFVCALA